MNHPTRKVVFVFGSNLAGIHGAGAAKEAALYWGAERGVGRGITGNSYAIPTKDRNIRTLSLDRIAEYFDDFMQYVGQHPDTLFLLTPIGTGLAGYSIEDIMKTTKVFTNPPRNLWFTGDWYRPAVDMVIDRTKQLYDARDRGR